MEFIPEKFLYGYLKKNIHLPNSDNCSCSSYLCPIYNYTIYSGHSFWFMIRVIKKILSKIKFIGKWPKWLLTIISSVLLLSFLVFAVEMITKNIQHLSDTLPVYEANINKITQSINQQFDVDLFTMFNDFAKDLNFGEILSKLFSALTGIFGDAFTVLLYLIFLLLEEPNFP